jgi:ribonuclease G
LNTLVINYLGREKRYALIKDDKLEKLVIEQPKQESSVGNIYFGTVTKVLPGMNAAFVDIGQAKNGFLHGDKLPASLELKDKNNGIASMVHQGEKLLVQVEKDATGNKGPRLTGIIELTGHCVVYMPRGFYIAVSKKIEDPYVREDWRQFGLENKREEEGILFRTACEQTPKEAVLEELEELRERYKKMIVLSQTAKKPGLILEKDSFIEEIQTELSKMNRGEIIVDHLELKQMLAKGNRNEQLALIHFRQKENIFTAYGIDHEIEKALKRIVWLEKGAYLIFDETEALTIIDVNTGKFSGKNNLRDTIIKTNELAAAEIARQLRLRDIGGMVLIDFIDMKDAEDRNRVRKTMERSLKYDEKRTRIVGFTPLGILQLTRKRTKVSISENLETKCEICHGTGKVLSPETVAFQLERELLELRNSDYEGVLVETTREVQEIFSGSKNIEQERLEEFIGLKIVFSIIELAKPSYNVKQLGDLENIMQTEDQ